MKIQLLLANQEVELTKQVQIPLNKSFQNLWNPTDIVVDYSKSVSIPMTTANNRILGNAYRLDRNVVKNIGEGNIGIYLDPTKKIPFTLLYNGELLMEGYAKFVSANFSATNKFYNINLFGSLGEYFLKMKSIVTSVDKLTDEQKLSDEGIKYVLNDHLGHTSLNAEYVKNSWLRENNNINDFSDTSIIDQDIIGFAPAYRGYYGLNFKSNKVQVNDNETESLSTMLKDEWKLTYCFKNYGETPTEWTEEQKKRAEDYANALDAESVIGDGMKDYQMGEYRSYHQRPYIYFNKLMYMFQEKSKDLTGYDLKLDPSWFNPYNPYWTKLVYTLNYLEDIDVIPSQVNNSTLPSANFQFYKTPTNQCFGQAINTFRYTANSSHFEVDDLKLSFNAQIKLPQPIYSWGLTTRKHCAIVYKFILNTSKGSYTQYKWSSLGKEDYMPPVTGLNASNSLKSTINSSPFWYDKNANYYLTVNTQLKEISFNLPEGVENEEITLTIESSIYSDYDSPFYLEVDYWSGEMKPVWDYFDYFSAFMASTDLSIRTNASNSISLGLDILYLEEKPIFDVILQYTKMFNLLWKIDNKSKEVTICRKSTYFKDIKVEDWNNKLDRTKDYIIEPVTFESKYVNFNYEDVDGHKYISYKDKYGISYGTKKLKTGYDFDSNDKDLFTGVKPSIISQRQFIKYSDLRDWDLSSNIISTIDEFPRIESVDKDDANAINESSWYFRNENYTLDNPVFITDDSPLMIENNEYCWFTHAYLTDMDKLVENRVDYIKSCSQIPLMSPVTTVNDEYYGCLFNCPNEDYTSNKSIANAKGRYIYDNIWDVFLNERYDVNNKKLTAYFNIHPWEYMIFDFDKFVTLDNQLWMVNKIFDYDPNSSSTTKCELVQVTKMSAYSHDTLLFHPGIVDGGGDDGEDVPVIPEQPTEDTYMFEPWALIERLEYEGGQYTTWIQSLKNGESFPFTKDDVTISGISGATVDSVEEDDAERGNGIYAVKITIPRNDEGRLRTATLKIVQPVSSKEIEMRIEQNYKVITNTRKVAIIAEPYYDKNLAVVDYQIVFDATNTYGGALSNVVIQIGDASGSSGNVLASKSLGTITVPRGTKTAVYTGRFTNININDPWFKVYYDNNLQYESMCVQLQDEPWSLRQI